MYKKIVLHRKFRVDNNNENIYSKSFFSYKIKFFFRNHLQLLGIFVEKEILKFWFFRLHIIFSKRNL